MRQSTAGSRRALSLHHRLWRFRIDPRAPLAHCEADRPLPIEADGEVLGQTPATFEVIPQATRVKL